jgi:hypothetical protein
MAVLTPQDNAFGILKEGAQAPAIDTSEGGAFARSALDAVIERYEDRYRKKAREERELEEQRGLNNEVTDTFNSCLTYYRSKLLSLSSMNVHRKQAKTPYSGVHAQAGALIKNESFFTEELLFIKVLFAADWGGYHFVPPDLQAGQAQGKWEGEAPVQLLIGNPPHTPLLASVYARVLADGKVRLNHMPAPLHGVGPDILPRELYLYCFYNKPKGV